MNSNLYKKLHDGDGGTLTKDEGSADEGHQSPNSKDNSEAQQAEITENTHLTCNDSDIHYTNCNV